MARPRRDHGQPFRGGQDGNRRGDDSFTAQHAGSEKDQYGGDAEWLPGATSLDLTAHEKRKKSRLRPDCPRG